MKRTALLILMCAVCAAPGAASARRHARTHVPRPPVVVELFTAQGCSSCGKANAFVVDLAEKPGVVALTWPVDYWDYLGWKDTFARPEFTDRQRAYDRRFGLRDVYTPQVVVDGAVEASGARTEAVQRLIDQAERAPADPPQMLLTANGRIAVGSGRPPKGGADVWLIRYDPRAQEVEVTGGDNRGQKVPHRNVVRELVKVGPWAGRPVLYRVPAASEEGLETVFLLQARTGKILNALKPEAPKV